jgi:hypothetical protein
MANGTASKEVVALVRLALARVLVLELTPLEQRKKKLQ